MFKQKSNENLNQTVNSQKNDQDVLTVNDSPYKDDYNRKISAPKIKINDNTYINET